MSCVWDCGRYAVCLGKPTHSSKGGIARSLTHRSVCNRASGITAIKPRLPQRRGTYCSLVRRTKYALSTGRSSDSASSPAPLLGRNANGNGFGSTSQQRSCRRLALRSLFSQSPAFYPCAGDPAPVNTRVFCCQFNYSIS